MPLKSGSESIVFVAVNTLDISLCQPFGSTQGTGEGFPVSVSNVLFSTGANPKHRAGQCCSGTHSTLILL